MLPLKLLLCTAGLSPPPSLFNGAPTIPLTTTADGLTTSSADIDLSSSSSDDSGEGEEEKYSKPGKERRLWVQCEHSSCGKWRLVPKCTKIDTKRSSQLAHISEIRSQTPLCCICFTSAVPGIVACTLTPISDPVLYQRRNGMTWRKEATPSANWTLGTWSGPKCAHFVRQWI